MTCSGLHMTQAAALLCRGHSLAPHANRQDPPLALKHIISKPCFLLCARHIAGEMGSEWQERLESDAPTEDLLTLIHQIVPFHMAHNAEPEAVDLLLEVRVSTTPEGFAGATRRPCARGGRVCMGCTLGRTTAWEATP